MIDTEIDGRLITLESIITEHERTIKDLNDIVAKQADKIDQLEKMVFYLVQNYDGSGTIKPLSEEVPPPHY